MDKALQILQVRGMFYFIFSHVHCFQDEFEMNLRLLGAPTIKDVVPDMVDASNIGMHIVSVPTDRLYDSNCKSKASPSVKFGSWSVVDETLQPAQLRSAKSRL